MTETKTVRLGDLEHDPVAIEDREDRLSKLDDLMASIPAAGQLQSLRVRPWVAGAKRPTLGKRGRPKASETEPGYGVLAGNRRLATLRRLRDEGGKVQSVVVTDDFPVHVIEGDLNDADAQEATTAENMQRLADTPVAEFRQFKRMADAGKPPKTIASHFGIGEKRVLQRLKLAALHADVLAALEGGTITMEAAEAFTLEADPKRQAKYLKDNGKQSWKLQGHAIRQAFTQKTMTSNSPQARLVGKKAYLAAGGQVLEDSFGVTSYWLNPEIVDKLLVERMAEQISAWKEDGWLFVETVDEYREATGQGPWGQKVLRPEPVDPPAAIKTQLDELAAKLAALIEQHPDLDEDFDGADAPDGFVWAPQEVDDAYDELIVQLEALRKDLPAAFTAEQRGASGVVYWPDGSREPALGVTRPMAQLGNGSSAAPADRPATLDDVGAGLSLELSRVMTASLRTAIGGNAELAIRALVAMLSVNAKGHVFSYTLPAPTILKVEGPIREGEADDEFTFGAALAEGEGKDLPALLVELAGLFARTVTVATDSGTAAGSHRPLIDLVDPAIGGFDPDDYFKRITKPLVVLAWREMTGGETLKDGKKGDMAKLATAKARETGWLPPQLRTPGYAGPQRANPLAIAAE